MSTSEDKDGPGFVVIDKRGQRETEAETPAAEVHGAAGDSAEQEESRERELPKVDFASFVISLGSSAMLHLGVVPDPETQQTAEPDLQMARHIIDSLEMLQGKTAGNLETPEEQLLQNLLTELRMRFVEASR